MRERGRMRIGEGEGGREGGRETVRGKELLSAFFCLLSPCLPFALPNINDHCRESPIPRTQHTRSHSHSVGKAYSGFLPSFLPASPFLPSSASLTRTRYKKGRPTRNSPTDSLSEMRFAEKGKSGCPASQTAHSDEPLKNALKVEAAAAATAALRISRIWD